MRSITGPHHVGIVVRDLERSRAWYQEKLGFIERTRDYVAEFDLTIAYIARGSFEIELFQSGAFHELSSPEQSLMPSLTYQGIRHLAFSVDSCDAAWDEMEALGIERHVPPTTNEALGVRYCFAKDPDGILLEFLERI